MGGSIEHHAVRAVLLARCLGGSTLSPKKKAWEVVSPELLLGFHSAGETKSGHDTETATDAQ